jgi:hypothetical protein
MIEYKRTVNYHEGEDLFIIQEGHKVLFACYDFKKSFPEVLTSSVDEMYNVVSKIFNF